MFRSIVNQACRRPIWFCAVSLLLAGFDPLSAANNAPAAAEDHATISSTAAVSISVLANDSDPDSQPLTLVSVTTPSKGTASVSGSNVVYTPGPSYSGFDYFYYTVRDSQNAVSQGLISTHPPYTVPNASDKYHLWAATKFGSDMTSNPARKDSFWGENADADGDGDSNLLEYATGSEPLDWSQRANVFHDDVIAPGYLALRVQQRTDDTDLVFIPQMSLGLSSWLPSLPSTAKLWTGDSTYIYKVSESAPSGGFKNVVYATSASKAANAALFMRLVTMRDETTVSSVLTPFTFTAQGNAGPGQELHSNTVIPAGFAGTSTISVGGGARLIINGVDRGTSYSITAGDQVYLKGTAPASAGAQTFTVTLGTYNTSWTIDSKPVPTVPDVSGTVAGFTPFSADALDSGAASITVPITVVPGTGGMQPKLAITYSSQGGNGLLGYGFGLSALSVISRTGQTKAHDGVKIGVSLTANDRFSWDGQRLMLISGTEGTAGAVYRTEFDTFARITCLGSSGTGPSSWTVETKDGMKYEFGATADSAIKATGKQEVLFWAVNQITDLAGNSMSFVYAGDATEGTTTGHYRIAAINYTANANASPALTAQQSVEFTYATRPDVRTNYIAGSKIEVSKRLTSIACKRGSSTLRRYELAYQQAEISGDSQLISVTEYGTDGSALPPTQFTWHADAADDFTSSTNIGGTTNPEFIAADAIMPGDFDGEGRLDILRVGTTSASFPSTTWLRDSNGDGTFTKSTAVPGLASATVSSVLGAHRMRTGDFNADGLTDFFHASQNAKLSNNANFIGLSKRDGSFAFISGAALGPVRGMNPAPSTPSEILTMDANGDGRSDIIRLESGRPFVGLSQSDGSFLDTTFTSGLETLAVDKAFGNSWVIPGEFNGDGHSDILHLRNTGGHWLALGRGDGTFETRTSTQMGGFNGWGFINSYNNSTGDPLNTTYMVSGDFNADGLTDVFAHESDPNKSWMFICQGDGTFLRSGPVAGFPADSNVRRGQESQLLSGDFNGDGYTDILHLFFDGSFSASYRPWLALGKGNGTVEFRQGAAIPQFKDIKWTTDSRSRCMVADYDGDGRDELLVLESTKAATMVRSTGFNRRLVTQVTNGHGAYTKFTYKPLTDPSVYQGGTSGAYPMLDVKSPIMVVASFTSRNGMDGSADVPEANPTLIGESTTTMLYGEIQAHMEGRGFRGPRYVERTDVNRGIVTRTEYETSILLAGKPNRVITKLTSGTVISDTQNTWTLRTDVQGGKTLYFPFISGSVSRQYEINSPAAPAFKTTTVSNVTYNTDGDLLTQNSDSGDGYTTSVVNQYQRTETPQRWHLGRLAQSEVTRKSPGPGDGERTLKRTSSWQYDAVTGLLEREIIEPDVPASRMETSYLRDAYGNITSASLLDVARNLTRTSLTRYSTDGRFPVESENALGHIERKTFDPLTGQPISLTGPNNITTTWEYDAFARPIREARADGTQTRTWYLRATPGIGGAPARAVHMVRSQASGQAPSVAWFDVNGREIGKDTLAFDGRTLSTAKQFNAKGEVVKSSMPFYSGGVPRWTSMEYDAISRPTRITAPGNRVTSTTYAGLTTTVTDPLLHTATTIVNPLGKPIETRDHYNSSLKLFYDPFENLIQTRDPANNRTEITFDIRGFKTQMVEPNTGTTRYTYNAFGEMLTQTDNKNQTVTLAYDALGRMISRTEPEGTSLWEYDTAPLGIGKLARNYRLADDFEETSRYDIMGRPLQVITRIGSQRFPMTTTYDSAGRAETLTYPTGFAVRYVYNARGHLTEVQEAATPANFFWRAVSVNEDGQVEQELLGNGLTTRRSYDRDKTLVTSIRTGVGTGTTIQNLSYQWDNAGNLTQRRDERYSLQEDFGYDALNRLTQVDCTNATRITVTYDALGNITSRSDVGTYTYAKTNNAGPHAVTSITGGPAGSKTYQYDPVGNRVLTVGGLTGDYTSFNVPSRLVSGNTTTTFNYDTDRERYRQQEQTGLTIKTKIYIATDYERQVDGATVSHVHFIKAGDKVIAFRKSDEVGGGVFANTTTWNHFDHLGSFVSSSNQAGTVSASDELSFDSWGRRRTVIASGGSSVYQLASAASTLTERGFTGHEMLEKHGLVHMNGRCYDESIGQMMSADPIIQAIENVQAHNRYSYVHNSVLSRIDPDGFVPQGQTVTDVVKSDAILSNYQHNFSNEPLPVNLRWNQGAITSGYYSGGSSFSAYAAAFKNSYDSTFVKNILNPVEFESRYGTQTSQGVRPIVFLGGWGYTINFGTAVNIGRTSSTATAAVIFLSRIIGHEREFGGRLLVTHSWGNRIYNYAKYLYKEWGYGNLDSVFHRRFAIGSPTPDTVHSTSGSNYNVGGQINITTTMMGGNRVNISIPDPVTLASIKPPNQRVNVGGVNPLNAHDAHRDIQASMGKNIGGYKLVPLPHLPPKLK